MKLVFVNRYFLPDLSATSQILGGIARGLAGAGLTVLAVTSRYRYAGSRSPLPACESISDVSVRRVWTTSFGRGNLVGRAVDYLTFYLASATKLLSLLVRGDILIVKTDPPLLSVVGALCARVRGTRLINWHQDIYPEVAAELGLSLLRSAFGAPLRGIRNWSLRVAEANIVLSDGMAERLKQMCPGARVHVIHNWADGETIRPLPASPRGDRFVVGYSGNMGRAHEFGTILGACEVLNADRGIGFVFTGGGQKRAEVERAVRERGLGNVELRPYVEEARLGESLAACDVHLVSLLPAVEGLIVPSKFYGIAAAGRPTLFIGDPKGEIAQLVRRHDIGMAVAPGDVDGLVAAIRELKGNADMRAAMGLRARRVFEAEWDKPIAIARWQSLLRDLG